MFASVKGTQKAAQFLLSRLPVSFAHNVLGEPLEFCSMRPMTGFHRDGCCTGPEDVGSHTVCAVMTAAFLDFS
ncbi:MAG: DUF2237 family protein, partial [Pseudolabrys sp.]